MNELKPSERRAIVIDMDEAGDKEATEPKPPFYYAEQAQQTEFDCVKCGDYNDVRGRFAYCASCGWKNNREQTRAKLESVRERLNSGSVEAAGALRDAVAEFDACCRDFAAQVSKRIAMKSNRRAMLERAFHDTDASAIEAMKACADIDLLRGLSEADIVFLKLMMHRRHVHEHLGGVADEKYVRESGDKEASVGDLLREDRGDVHRAMGLLNKMIANLERDFHEIFQPTEWPIRHYNDTQARTGR